MNQQLEVEEKDQVKSLVAKFQRKGFDSLSLEEVASAMILPNFSKQFYSITGQDWVQRYEVKAIERLSKARFDIHWMTRKDGGDPHTPLFVNSARGDINKLRLYLKECKDPQVKKAVDQQKRSPLHIAAMEGRTSTVEFLLLQGFNPNARDKLLRTPLHYAALYGWDTATDTLLKTGADIFARDTQGQSVAHMAASGPSALLLSLIIATRPELVNDLDHRRRTPLHYCVWNSSQSQIDLLRTLLDSNADPNALDEDLKTPLHHCAEGGRTRAIPLLLQRGSLESMSLRDKNGKLPLESAQNDRTRELLVVYSAAPFNHKPDDVQWMDQALQGQKKIIYKEANAVDVARKPSTAPLRKTNFKEKPKSPEKEELNEKNLSKSLKNINEPQQQSWGPSSINEWVRQKFFVMLKNVQEAGINANHHIKKPYIYTGSWMEGINTMEELYESIKDVNPGEVCMRVFNVLCPYDRPLPQKKGTEETVDGFHGEQWYDTSAINIAKRSEDQERFKRQLQLQYVNKISELETALKISNESLSTVDEELGSLKTTNELIKKQLDDSYKKIAENQNKYDNQINDLKQQLKNKEDFTQKQKKEIQRLQKKISDIESELDHWKNVTPPQPDYSEYTEEINNLKQKLVDARQKEMQKLIRLIKNRGLRVELATLKSTQKQNQIKLKELQKQLEEQQKQADEIQKENSMRQVQPQIELEGVENMQDDDAVISLFKALKGNPPPMRQRMRNQDVDADENLTMEEFCQFLDILKISPADQESLCRIATFSENKKLLGIEEWVQILQDRPKQREIWEQQLFTRFLDAINKKGLSIQQTFELLDTNKSGTITPNELNQGLKNLKIYLNQRDLNNMFCIFDSDKNNYISLSEMQQTLENFQKMKIQEAEGDVIDGEQRLEQQEDEQQQQQEIAIQNEEELELTYDDL